MLQFEQHQLSVVCITHFHSKIIPQLVSSCLSVWVLCWLSPHTSAVSSVGQSVFVFAQQPSKEYNAGHFLQHQEPLPLEHSLKCTVTFNIFTPSFSRLQSPAWVVVRSPGAPCLLWNVPFAEAAPSLSCHHQCPCTGTAAPQPPSRLQGLQSQSLQASAGWDFHEGKVVMQVRRILTAEESACGNYGACLDWYLRLERLAFLPSHYYNYYYTQLLSVHNHSAIIPSCQNPLKMMQLTHEARDEARLDLADECELLIWSSGSFLFGNCKKKTKTKNKIKPQQA